MSYEESAELFSKGEECRHYAERAEKAEAEIREYEWLLANAKSTVRELREMNAQLRTEVQRSEEAARELWQKQVEQLRTERDRLRDLRNAVWEWWRTKRPVFYTPQMHHDNPHVNAVTDAERLVIDKLLAALNQREEEEDEEA